MAFKNFASELFMSVSDTGVKNCLGKITSANEFTLDTARVVFYMQGVASAGGSETIQLKLYSDSALTKEYAVSNVLTVSDFVTGSTNWIGFVGFTFATLPNINAAPLYAALEASSYTRSGDTFYIGVPADWPINHNDIIPGYRGMWIELYGYQDRDDIQ